MEERAFSDGERAAVKCYGANDVLEGVAIMQHEGVDVSITGNSTNPHPLQHLVAGTYKKWAIENGKKYFSVASGGGTGRTPTTWRLALLPMALTDSMAAVCMAMLSSQFFLRSGSRRNDGPAIGMGNNPMVGRCDGSLRCGCV